MEVLVGTFFIVVGLVGAMILINQSLASGSFGASRLVAANLAQEGVELVKNIRDLTYGASSWDAWYASVAGSNDYIVQYNDTSLRPFVDQPLKYDEITGLYSYDAGVVPSVAFRRKITLTKVSDNEAKVACLVTWTEKGRNYNLLVEDRLWNWR